MVATLANACLPRFVLRRLADESRPLLEAERDDFQAAVLFADLSGFTPLAEHLALQGHEGAEALAALLNESVGVVTETIAAHGGDLVKFVGDAVIALWPAGDERLAHQVRRAELCARQAMARLDARSGDAAQLRLHAGIGAGEVSTILAGGFAGRWYSTVAGPALQQAGAAAQSARHGQVLLSAAAAAISLAADAAAAVPPTNGAPLTSDVAPLHAGPETSNRLRAFLPEALTARADAGQLDWLAELRPVTALFVGLHGFGEQAAEVLSRVQETMGAMQPLVARFGGLLKEFTFDDKGCTVVAAFGAPPLAHEDNELRALRVAEELHGTLAQRGIASSVGIASGRALCGLVGSAQRREYTIVGSAMNRAARLLQFAGGNVVCDDSTRQAAQGAMRFESLGSAVLKGVATPLEVYRASSQPAPLSADYARPLIGRQREREQLAALLAEFGRLRGPAATRVIAIEGEAGIGKSRLAATLRSLPEGMALIECRGDPVESMMPYAAWRTAFRRLLEVDLISDAETLRQRVNAVLSRNPEDLRLAPLLGAVLPVAFPENEDTGSMDGLARAETTRGLLLRVIRRHAGEQRAVILIEDAQHLDSASWQMVQALSEADTGMLLVIVLRASDPLPDEYSLLLAKPGTVRIQLGEFDAQDTALLLESCLGASSIQEAVAQFVRERAGGHPLFVEHLGQTLLASGLVEIDAGECRLRRGATDLAQAMFPDTVQGILRASIDRLPPSEQLTLKAASVIGAEFQLALLARVHPTRPSFANLRQEIDRLVALGILVVRKHPFNNAFAFRQAVMQQVAYELLLFAQRRELHLAVARSWSAQSDEGSDARLAHHYGSAIDPASPDPDTCRKAAQYSARAGAAALHAGAYREATRLLQRALHWLEFKGEEQGDPFQLATLNRQLGDALSGLGDLGGARRHHERALALLGNPAGRTALRTLASLVRASARQFRHRLRLPRPYTGAANREALESVRAYERLAEIDFFDNQPIQSLRWSLLGLNAAEACGTSPELARISGTMAVTAGLLRLHGLARIYEQQGLAACAGITELAARAWSAMATALYRVGIGDWAIVEQSIDAARGLYQRIGHRRYWEASSYIKLMVLAHHHGRLEDSSALAAEVELSGVRSGNVQAEAWGLMGQAENALRQQRVEEALPQLLRAAALIPQGIGRAEETRVHALLAWAQLAQGDRQQAATHLREALSRIRGSAPATYYSLEAYAAAARVAVALADHGSSAASSGGAEGALAREALKALHGFAKVFPIALPRALLIDGLRHWQDGARDRARALLHRSAAAAAGLKMPYEQALAQAALGERLEGEAAQDHRRRALQLFDELGIRPASAGEWAYTSDAKGI